MVKVAVKSCENAISVTLERAFLWLYTRCNRYTPFEKVVDYRTGKNWKIGEEKMDDKE
jgi:hypothetical protein